MVKDAALRCLCCIGIDAPALVKDFDFRSLLSFVKLRRQFLTQTVFSFAQNFLSEKLYTHQIIEGGLVAEISSQLALKTCASEVLHFASVVAQSAQRQLFEQNPQLIHLLASNAHKLDRLALLRLLQCLVQQEQFPLTELYTSDFAQFML